MLYARPSTHQRFARSIKLIRKRLYLLAAAGSILLLLLLVRVGWMQTVHTEHFTVLSAENHLQQIPIAPPRGLIFDRHGTLLVDNSVHYRLSLIPAQAADLDATLQHLQTLLQIREQDLRYFRRQSRSRKFSAIPIKLDLSQEEIARVSVHLPQLPGVLLEAYPRRRHAHHDIAAHALGYLAHISEQDRQNLDLHRYRGVQRIGRTGVEHQYENLLLGASGLAQAEVNARGRILTLRDRQAPQPGSNLILTLDIELQRVATEAMRDRKGSVVAIEPQTGDVLALVSAPSFDPGLFGYRIDPDSYEKLTEDARNPLLNRAIQGKYAPGSTIKPFMALAGLETGYARLEEWFFAEPHFKLPNHDRPFRDWKDEGHGWVTLASSITQSCDVYFYDLAHRMGIENIHNSLAKFGLGQLQQLDLPGEHPGLLPSTQWKLKAYGQPWYPGETVSLGIGQGYMLTTPLQLATATAMLATRGVRMQPRLLRAYGTPQDMQQAEPVVVDRLELSNPEWWDAITEAMIDVVHAPHGTAHNLSRNIQYRMAGKTGTAQIITYGEERLKTEDIPEHIRDHSLFIAFAPVENPRIALAIIIEHGGHGSTAAAPLARQLLDTYLLRSS